MNHRVCVYLNLDYLRYKFGMKFQLGGAKFEMKFCLSEREFKAILSKFIEINADTIKFLEKQSCFYRKFYGIRKPGRWILFKARR